MDWENNHTRKSVPLLPKAAAVWLNTIKPPYQNTQWFVIKRTRRGKIIWSFSSQQDDAAVLYFICEREVSSIPWGTSGTPYVLYQEDHLLRKIGFIINVNIMGTCYWQNCKVWNQLITKGVKKAVICHQLIFRAFLKCLLPLTGAFKM